MLRAADTIAKTDTGRQRRDNEDSAFARAPVFVVADGMGGAQAGEVASRIAVEVFAQGLPDSGSAEQRLADRVIEANRQIFDVSRSERERAGMGTTLTAALLEGSDLAIAHVGDSRAYLFRDGSLKRLTQDHSLVDELVRRGKLTEEQAAEHPQRSIITRALGPEPEVEVDTWTYPVRAGDVLLLCSDGLTSMVPEERVEAILSSSEGLADVAQALIDEANTAGGRDNITVVLFRLEEVEGGGDGSVDQPTMVGVPAVKARSEGAPPAAAPAPAPGAQDEQPTRQATGTSAEAAVAGSAAGSSRRRAERDSSAGAPPFRGSPLAQAGRRRDRGHRRPLSGAGRRLPGHAPALLHRHELAGDRDHLPRPPLRPAGGHPSVRDVLRIGPAGVARASRSPLDDLQQQPALAVGRLLAGATARAGKGLLVSAGCRADGIRSGPAGIRA